MPTLGTMRWIGELGWRIQRKWRPYYHEGMVAGFIEERDGLTFATVRGAGHAVPQYKPAEAYKLVFNWIDDRLDQL